MDYGKNFLKFCVEQQIGNLINDKVFLSQSEFEEVDRQHSIISVNKGGLVLGHSHAEGGVHMLYFNLSENMYEYVGEMEGMEYISGELFIPQLKDFYVEINNKHSFDEYEEDPEFEAPEDCNVYDLRGNELQVILLKTKNVCIINRNATQKCIKELVESEKLYNV